MAEFIVTNTSDRIMKAWHALDGSVRVQRYTKNRDEQWEVRELTINADEWNRIEAIRVKGPRGEF